MSDEKKPFAEVVPDDHKTGDEWEVLLVAGERMTSHRPAYGGDALDVMAERINEAVDQREAKLYTRLMVARQLAESMREPGALGPIDDIIGTLGDVDVYAPRPAEVGAAFDAGMRLGLLERLHEGTWGVLRDHLMETQGPLRATAMGLVKELGLSTETFVPLHKRNEAVEASGTSDLLMELAAAGRRSTTLDGSTSRSGRREIHAIDQGLQDLWPSSWRGKWRRLTAASCAATGPSR